MGLFKAFNSLTGFNQYQATRHNRSADGNQYEVPAYEIFKENKKLCDCGRPRHWTKKDGHYKKCLSCLHS